MTHSHTRAQFGSRTFWSSGSQQITRNQRVFGWFLKGFIRPTVVERCNCVMCVFNCVCMFVCACECLCVGECLCVSECMCVCVDVCASVRSSPVSGRGTPFRLKGFRYTGSKFWTTKNLRYPLHARSWRGSWPTGSQMFVCAHCVL